MTTADIFTMVTNVLNNNMKDDVNCLYNLSHTCKEMNELINVNTDYDILKNYAKYNNLCDAINYVITPTEKKNETKHFFPLSRFGFQPVNDLI
jgi:hypothetical protein